MSIALRHTPNAVLDGQLVVITSTVDPESGRQEVIVPHGMSVEQILTAALPYTSDAFLSRVHVALGKGPRLQFIPRSVWHRAWPNRDTYVVVKVVPAGTVGKQILGLLVTVAASAITGFLAPILQLGTFGKSLLTMGLTAAGGLLINLLFKSKSDDEEKPTYAITSWRNEASPGSTVPALLGEMRYAPRFGATPWTQIVGDDVYVRAVLELPFGPLEVEDIKIGDTPLEKFEGVEYELRYGYPGDAPLSIYPSQVIETSEGVALSREGEDKPQTRFSARDATSACAIFAFTNGLYGFREGGWFSSGGIANRWVGLNIKYKLVGAEDWADIIGLWFEEDGKTKPFYRECRWDFPVRGDYEIEYLRTTDDTDNSQESDQCTLFVQQSFRPEYPFNHAYATGKFSLNIRSSKQLNGVVDNVNMLLRYLCRDWDGAEWTVRSTRNPAAHAIAVLTGPAGLDAAPDADIDWPAFEDWHDFCVSKGLHYDRMHDFAGTREDVLKAVGAAGRAIVFDDGEKWTVVIDRPRSIIVDEISPLNASQFAWTSNFFKPPHAVRVQFIDRANKYQPAEMLVPWPPAARFALLAELEAELGFAEGIRCEVYADPVQANNGYYEKAGAIGTGSWSLASFDITEEWDLPGKTEAAEVWREIRRRQYEAIHRSVSYTAVQRGLARSATKGDQLTLSHDVIETAVHSARVTQVVGQLIVVQPALTMAVGQRFGIQFRVFEDDDDAVGHSVVREVKAVDGETSSLMMVGDGEVPAPNAIVQFGPLGSESLPVILFDVKTGSKNTSVLYMLPAAPIIDELTDNEVAPPWNGRVGQILSLVNTPPAAARIRAVKSGLKDTGSSNRVRVWFEPGQGSPAIVGKFQCQHRKVGETAWTGPAEVQAAAANLEINAYVAGDHIELQPRALSIQAIPGDWGAVVTHTVGAADAGAALAVSVATVGTFNLGGALIQISAQPADTNIRGVEVYRRPAGTPWDPDVDPLTMVMIGAGEVKQWRDGANRSSLYADPDFNIPSAHTATGNFAVANGQATKTATTLASRLYQTLGAAPATGSAIRMAALVSATNDTDTFGFFLRNDVATAADAGTMSPSTGTGLRRGRINVTAARTLLGVTTSATRTITIEAMAGFVEQAGDLAAGDYTYRFVSLNGDDRAGAYSEITVSIV